MPDQHFQETRGGRREGSGRKTKIQRAERMRLRDKLTQEGNTPLEIIVGYMLQFSKLGKAAEALSCANMAAPYLHPRLAAVAVQTTKTELTLAELIEQSFKPQLEIEKTITIEASKIELIDDLL